MSSHSDQLPVPNADELAISQRLCAVLRGRIQAGGGWIPFSEFMQAALYEPGLGYYAAGSVKFGSKGDFVTSPELSDLFAEAITETILPVLKDIAAPTILELGAGTGALAAQLLRALARRGLNDIQYRILEPSPDLCAQQRATLAQFGDAVTWITSLQQLEIEGVVIANEVLDALPVERFSKHRDGFQRLGVQTEGADFKWHAAPCDSTLAMQLNLLEQQSTHHWPEGFVSEYSTLLAPWISAVGAVIRRGAALLIDYGMPQRDFYRPERSSGTLTCHFRHRAHFDPLIYPGLQDITTWVDFSRVAAAAESAGLAVSGFTTQGMWLLETLVAAGIDLQHRDAPALAALKTLLLPGEMGERFKIMLLSRGVSPHLAGRDMRSWL